MLPCGYSAAVKCQGVFIETGGNMVISGAAHLVINDGGFKNNGTFTPATGTISFSGAAITPASFISGSSTTQFYNLSLNKTANGLQLNQHTAVSNTLHLISGDSIFLNAYNIDLGSNGIISGETDTRHITGAAGGYIQSTQVLNAPASVNPGNLGIQITSSSNLGSTVVRRGHIMQTNGTNNGIKRYFDIQPSSNSGLDATLRFYYFQTELAGIPETELMPFTSDNGGVSWQITDYSILDISQNFIEQNGFNELNRITLAGIYTALPVKEILLSAVASGNRNIVSWKTVDENGISSYTVERSNSGISFYPLYSVAAKGNTVGNSFYSFTDAAPLNGTGYYRIKVIDLNAHHSYSKTVAVNQAVPSDAVTIYPNPADRLLHINYFSDTAATVTIRITGITGNTVLLQKAAVQKGFNEINCPAAHLPNGMYTVQIVSAGCSWHSSFIKAGTN